MMSIESNQDVICHRGKILHILMGSVLIVFDNNERYWIKIKKLSDNFSFIPHKEQKVEVKNESLKDFIYIFCKHCGNPSLKFFSNGNLECVVCKLKTKKEEFNKSYINY